MATISWGTGGGGDTALAWSGNSTLDDTRIVNEAIELDFAEFSATGAKALYHFNEGSGTQAADSSGNGYHATVSSGVWDDPSWMGVGVREVHNTDSFPFLNEGFGGEVTIEFFAKLPAVPPGNKQWVWHGAGWTGDETRGFSVGWREWAYKAQYKVEIRVCDGASYTEYDGPVFVSDQQWHHWAYHIKSGSHVRAWQDGVEVIDSAVGSLDLAAAISPRFGSDPSEGAFDACIDELRLTQGQVYADGDFTPPGRYPASGTVIAGNNTIAGMLTQVEWSSTETGGNEGDVSAVEVWTGGAWSAIGGTSPSSPISGLSLPVTAGNILRFTLTPKADTLRTETPVLTWAKATITPVIARYSLHALPRRFRLASLGPRFACLPLPGRFALSAAGPRYALQPLPRRYDLEAYHGN